jgi:hypothetical protein
MTDNKPATPAEYRNNPEGFEFHELPGRLGFVETPEMAEVRSALARVFAENTDQIAIKELAAHYQALAEALIEAQQGTSGLEANLGHELTTAFTKRDAAAAATDPEHQKTLLFDYKDRLISALDWADNLINGAGLPLQAEADAIDAEINRIFALVGRRPPGNLPHIQEFE